MLERLDGLIRRKATGDREALASRLGVSVRTVTNLKQELEDLGAKIQYDKGAESYMYCRKVIFNWSIVVSETEVEKIFGGQKISLENLDRAKYLPWWGRDLFYRSGDRSGVSRKPEL